MKTKKLHLIYIYACLMLCTLFACHDDDEPKPILPGLPGDSLTTTLIFYIAGENSLSSYMAADTAEIAAAMTQIPSDARVVVFIDDAVSSRLSVGMRNTPLQCVRTYTDNVNTTDSAQMLAVLTDIMRTYPARHYSLCMNSHASGWIFSNESARSAPRHSWGVDNGRRSTSNQGRKMDVPVLAHVLEQLPHLDFLFFDACYMQCVEVAYELRHVADFIMASPAEIPGEGAPYHLVLPKMCQQPMTTQVVSEMVNTYGTYYTTSDNESGSYGLELTAIRTDRLEALAEASRPVIRQLFAERAEVGTSDVQYYCPIRQSSLFSRFYDFGHLVFLRQPSAYETWRKALEEAVCSRFLYRHWLSAYSPSGSFSPHLEYISEDVLPYCAGVSIFVPSFSQEHLNWLSDYHTLQWYHAAGLSGTGW